MTESNDRAVIGGNSPPPHPLKIRTDELVAAANQWVTAGVADQENADSLSAFIDQLRAVEKEIEAARKKEKQPHLDAAAEVDRQFNPLKSLIETAKNLVMPKLTGWLQKVAAEKAELDRKAKEEADRLAKIAAEAAEKAAQEAAKGGDLVGATVAAEAAEKAAQEAAKTAQQQAKAPVNLQSSLGARTKSLRTYWHGRVTSHMAALAHFKNHPDVVAVVARLAEQAAGEKAAPIPGVEFYSEQKAA